MPTLTDILRQTETGILIRVRARPGIKQKRTPHIVDCGDGQYALEVTVADLATSGKANKAITKTIAGLLSVKRGDVSMKSGQTSRLKVIEVCGEAEALSADLAEFLGKE